MAINVLRPDTVEVFGGTLRPGLYLLDDGVDRPDVESIPRLKFQGGDKYLDSNDSAVKSIPALSSVAAPGDVLISISGGRSARTYLSSKTKTNTLLVTESCDNRCAFCSQPPKNSVSLFSQAWAGLQNFRHGGVFGVSGGEPTFYWSDFIWFSRNCAQFDIGRLFHVLSHGRNFSDSGRVSELSDTGFMSRTLWGIPLHGHTSSLHDGATGVEKSFFETLKGLVHLSFAGAHLEIRVIVTRQNCVSLPAIAKLIATYLGGSDLFVAFMNLEPIGWAKAHFKSLNVQRDRYEDPLTEAVTHLTTRKIDARLYNFPLCQLPLQLRDRAAQSISDWKNYFPEECRGCKVKADCCGFFASAEGDRITLPEPVL